MAVIFKEPKTREAIEAEADAIAKIKVQIYRRARRRDFEDKRAIQSANNGA